jgi:hypothetical protein
MIGSDLDGVWFLAQLMQSLVPDVKGFSLSNDGLQQLCCCSLCSSFDLK